MFQAFIQGKHAVVSVYNSDGEDIFSVLCYKLLEIVMVLCLEQY